MDAAQHDKIPGNGEHDVGPASRLLVAGVETERFRIDIGMMNQLTVIIDNLDGLPTLDGQIARIELLALLSDLIRFYTRCRQKWNSTGYIQNSYNHGRF